MTRHPFIANVATMSLYFKKLSFRPNTTYALTLDTLGGEMELWFQHQICEGGVKYIPPSDVWMSHRFVFTTKFAVNQLADWGISFVKCAWPQHAYGGTYCATYVDNVHLQNVTTGEELLTNGDFEEPIDSPAYDIHWRPSILCGNEQIPVAIVTDPLCSENHCLRFPEVVLSLDYPSPLPLQMRNFGSLFDVKREVRCIEFFGRPHLRCLLAVRGNITVEINDKEFHLSGGDMILLPADTPYRYTYHEGDNTLYYWLSFDGEHVPTILSKLGLDNPTPRDMPTIESLSAIIEKMATQLPNSVTYRYAVSGYLSLFFAEMERQLVLKPTETKHQAFIKDIADRIRQEPEKTLSNEELAMECGITENYFIHLFKQVMGVTPQKYRTRTLIRRACRMLTETKMTVQEIAYSLNIEDPFYFSRLFKSVEGVSPREYRKQQQKTHRS